MNVQLVVREEEEEEEEINNRMMPQLLVIVPHGVDYQREVLQMKAGAVAMDRNESLKDHRNVVADLNSNEEIMRVVEVEVAVADIIIIIVDHVGGIMIMTTTKAVMIHFLRLGGTATEVDGVVVVVEGEIMMIGEDLIIGEVNEVGTMIVGEATTIVAVVTMMISMPVIVTTTKLIKRCVGDGKMAVRDIIVSKNYWVKW